MVFLLFFPPFHFVVFPLLEALFLFSSQTQELPIITCSLVGQRARRQGEVGGEGPVGSPTCYAAITETVWEMLLDGEQSLELLPDSRSQRFIKSRASSKITALECKVYTHIHIYTPR